MSGFVITMLAGRIALWDLAFLIGSNRAHLFPSKLLNYPQFHTWQPNRSSAACITSMNGQRQPELINEIIAEDRGLTAQETSI